MKKYLSIKQVCELLPVCKSLVYRLVDEGVIPSTRLGGKILIPEDGLMAVLELSPAEEGHIELPPSPTPSAKPRSGRRPKAVDLW